MKKLWIALSILLLMSAPLQAGTQAVINMAADVQGQLALTVEIFRLDTGGNPVGGNLAPNLRFGTLEPDGAGGLKGTEAFAAVLRVGTSSQAYRVVSDMAPLSSDGNVLPNAVMLEPVRAADFEGGEIPGDGLDTGGRSAVGAGVPVYDSNASGSNAVLELRYSIPGGASPFSGSEPIPEDQPAGQYVGVISYSLTTV